jgi:hypothetical protein
MPQIGIYIYIYIYIPIAIAKLQLQRYVVRFWEYSIDMLVRKFQMQGAWVGNAHRGRWHTRNGVGVMHRGRHKPVKLWAAWLMFSCCSPLPLSSSFPTWMKVIYHIQELIKIWLTNWFVILLKYFLNAQIQAWCWWKFMLMECGSLF